MKKFEKKVAWNFNISVKGHGRNVKEALESAAVALLYQIESEFHSNDFQNIEDREVISIDEDDVEED